MNGQSEWPYERPQSPGFTLGVRQPGQTFSACMAANSGNYSISGTLLGGHAQAVAGNDVANLAFGNASEGTAGLFFSEGGSRAFAGGVGTVMTAGRRTASITSLNLEGVTGPAPMILGKTGAEVAEEGLSGVAELRLAADAGLTGAERLVVQFRSERNSGDSHSVGYEPSSEKAG